MIPANVAYIGGNGNSVSRIQPYRNRQDRISIKDVQISTAGTISHKPIANLSCFANPREYYRGESDVRPSYKGKEGPPRWCNGCPSRPACGTFASQRVEMDSDLQAKFERWSAATRAVGGSARYEHPTFVAFATASDQFGWASTNEDALATQRAADAKRKRQQREKEKRRDKRARAASPTIHGKLDAERRDREATLVKAARAPRAPTWLRNLTDASIAFTCDVWLVRATMERQHGGEMTSGDIARAMTALGRDHGKAAASLRVRVNDAVNRIGRLESSPDDAPIWGEFWEAENTISPRSSGRFLNGVESLVLEDA